MYPFSVKRHPLLLTRLALSLIFLSSGASPLVMCFGSDGHVAIEPLSYLAGESAGDAHGCGACTDIAVTHGEHGGCALASKHPGTPFVEFPTTSTAPTTQREASPTWASFRDQVPRRQTLDHSSVVLLI